MSKLPTTKIDSLKIKLTRYETRIKEIKKILSHTLVTFDENKELREFLRMYERLARETSGRIETLELKRKFGV